MLMQALNKLLLSMSKHKQVSEELISVAAVPQHTETMMLDEDDFWERALIWLQIISMEKELLSKLC